MVELSEIENVQRPINTITILFLARLELNKGDNGFTKVWPLVSVHERCSEGDICWFEYVMDWVVWNRKLF